MSDACAASAAEAAALCEESKNTKLSREYSHTYFSYLLSIRWARSITTGYLSGRSSNIIRHRRQHTQNVFCLFVTTLHQLMLLVSPTRSFFHALDKSVNQPRYTVLIFAVFERPLSITLYFKLKSFFYKLT